MSVVDYYNEKRGELLDNKSWAGLYYGVFSNVINENGFKNVAEFGIGFGTHAKQVLENTNVTKYYIIDPMEYYEDDYALGILRGEGTTENNFDEFYDLVDADLSNDFPNKYKWIRKWSKDVTNVDVADNVLDCAFVDMDHSYDAVTADLELAWAKVKSGGQILGDDYWMVSVAQAVNDFVQAKGATMDFVTNGSGYDIYRIYVEK